jgi:hypothetical protein
MILCAFPHPDRSHGFVTLLHELMAVAKAVASHKRSELATP